MAKGRTGQCTAELDSAGAARIDAAIEMVTRSRDGARADFTDMVTSGDDGHLVGPDYSVSYEVLEVEPLNAPKYARPARCICL